MKILKLMWKMFFHESSKHGNDEESRLFSIFPNKKKVVVVVHTVI